MADSAFQRRRVHHLLLLQKHLNLREGSSPLTLVLDSVEQSAKPLIQRYIQNAKLSKLQIIFVSYETLRPPGGVTHFLTARHKDPAAVRKDIAAVTSLSERTLLIIDSLHPLLRHPILPTYLHSLLQPHPNPKTPPTSLLAIYHLDIPHSSVHTPSYHPQPLTLLTYLATAILTTHSLPQTLARKRASNKSQPEPLFGLAEEREGVVVGMTGARGGSWSQGLVLEAEFRRKSGRGVEEWFFIPPLLAWGKGPAKNGQERKEDVGEQNKEEERPILLDDHPAFRSQESAESMANDGNGAQHAPGDSAVTTSTFELGLTAKQRKDREGVVLPYFDAQKGSLGDAGEGGRILYDFGVEDDFDEEEDDI